MYSLLHCLSLIIFLRQASNAHVTPEETLQRHCEWGAAKQHNKSGTHSATEPTGPGDTTP